MMFNLAAFSLYDLAFIIIAGITVTAALGVVLFKNIIYSALSLILAFLGAAAIYFQLNSSFLGVIQILVYAGAISVLIIFAIMLVMNRPAGESNLSSPRTREVFTGATITAMLFTALIAVIGFTQWPIGAKPGPDNSLGLLADLLLGDYVIAFEAAAILLLVAVVGAIILAKGGENK
ncbi:MAG: NADH-quinone oxidoreductase subunit J [Syntrophomonadaceae bacterium]|jgi:NADH:ubiquinone oxidoreductase subunit 6 (subunit J)|nr:NADH-quinone oxidoreductase subunit J [Syntrophomonadaceae bacterium]